MRTTVQSDAVLNIYRGTTLTAPTNVFASLLTTITDLEAGTVGELSYTGYARQIITFGVPGAGGNGRQIASTAQLDFGVKTDAGSVTYFAFGIHTLVTGGSLTDIIFNDPLSPLIFTATDLPGNTLSHGTHGFANDQQCRVESIPGSGGLPTGLSLDTDYWVVNTAADALELSLTQGGGAVDITGVGEVLLMPFTPVTVNQNDEPIVASGNMILQDD